MMHFTHYCTQRINVDPQLKQLFDEMKKNARFNQLKFIWFLSIRYPAHFVFTIFLCQSLWMIHRACEASIRIHNSINSFISIQSSSVVFCIFLLQIEGILKFTSLNIMNRIMWISCLLIEIEIILGQLKVRFLHGALKATLFFLRLNA